MKYLRNYKYSVPIAGIVLAGLAWLAFGFFGIQTAFIDDEVSEAAPVFDVPAEPAVAADPAEPEVDSGEATGPTDASTDVASDAAAPEDDVAAPDDAADVVDAAEPATAEADTATTDDPAPADAPEPVVTEAPAETAPPSTEAPAPQIVTEASGSFTGTSRYDVTGEAVVLGNGTGQRFLRFEAFESSNGPDLNVYLFNPDDPNDFVDLGDLKGNIGDQNYEIAADVDLERYSQVSIWCVRFGTGFGSADLVAA